MALSPDRPQKAGAAHTQPLDPQIPLAGLEPEAILVLEALEEEVKGTRVIIGPNQGQATIHGTASASLWLLYLFIKKRIAIARLQGKSPDEKAAWAAFDEIKAKFGSP